VGGDSKGRGGELGEGLRVLEDLLFGSRPRVHAVPRVLHGQQRHLVNRGYLEHVREPPARAAPCSPGPPRSVEVHQQPLRLSGHPRRPHEQARNRALSPASGKAAAPSPNSSPPAPGPASSDCCEPPRSQHSRLIEVRGSFKLIREEIPKVGGPRHSSSDLGFAPEPGISFAESCNASLHDSCFFVPLRRNLNPSELCPSASLLARGHLRRLGLQ
jgi:hypothetical protein